MAITTVDGIVNALGNNSSRIIIDKANLANQVAGRYCSMWRATGQPGQGAIPTTAIIPTSSTLGAMGFVNQTAPSTSYLGYGFIGCSNATATIEIHDRLASSGGLVLNVTTLQTTNLPINLETLGLVSDRLGSADYGDVQWWLEVYSDGGATASNATINVTYNDNTTGNLNVQAVGGTLRVGHMIGLDILRPAGAAGKNIKGINSIQLSASTGTAGNFGFTATRPRATMPTLVANKMEVFDWAQLGFSEIPNGACLFPMVLPTTTSSGTIRGGGKIAHG